MHPAQESFFLLAFFYIAALSLSALHRLAAPRSPTSLQRQRTAESKRGDAEASEIAEITEKVSGCCSQLHSKHPLFFRLSYNRKCSNFLIIDAQKVALKKSLVLGGFSLPHSFHQKKASSARKPLRERENAFSDAEASVESQDILSLSQLPGGGRRKLKRQTVGMSMGPVEQPRAQTPRVLPGGGTTAINGFDRP